MYHSVYVIFIIMNGLRWVFYIYHTCWHEKSKNETNIKKYIYSALSPFIQMQKELLLYIFILNKLSFYFVVIS